MISNATTFFATRMRDQMFDSDLCRHALPIGLTRASGNTGSLIAPLYFVAQGTSVPVSRGRPPTRDV